MSLVSDQEWAEYKVKYGKTYGNESEDQMRRALFAKAKCTIETHNKKYEAGEVSFKMGINHLADLTEDEMAVLYGGKHK